MARIATYRLSTDNGPIVNGPLALVVPQAVALATNGTPATVTDNTGRSYQLAQRPDGAIGVTELAPAELFPTFDPATPAPWLNRARTMAPTLTEHTT